MLFRGFVVLILFLSFELSAGLMLTGDAARDFPDASCLTDLSGTDVGMPAVFGINGISGFDIQSICLYYDAGADTYFVGIRTFTDAKGFPLIFGDADGDGDPANTSNLLRNLRGTDQANLSGREFFNLSFDFDRDGKPDLATGVHTSGDLSGFQVTAGTTTDLLQSPFPTFYGGTVAGISLGALITPAASRPHLEFTIVGVRQTPGFSSIDLTDPDSFFQIYLTTGSFDDAGIAEDFFPEGNAFLKLTSEDLLDHDADFIPDARDVDDDNDGLSDLREKDLDIGDPEEGGNVDTDQDGVPDYLDTDSDGDQIPDKTEKDADLDGDGLPNFRDLDSDGDGLSDDEEDANDNGLVDPKESSPYRVDTDDDGLCDGNTVIDPCTSTEGKKKTKPFSQDSDGDGLCDGAVVVPPCRDAEDRLGTDPNEPNIETGLPQPAESGGPLGGDVDMTGGPVQLQGSGLSCSLRMSNIKFQISNIKSLFWLLFPLVILLVRRRRFILFFFISLFSAPAFALNVQHFRPAVDGLGVLRLDRSEPLPVGGFSLGAHQNLSHNSLEIGRTIGGARLDSVADWYWATDVWGAVGIFSKLNVGLNIPFSLLSEIEDLTSAQAQTTVSMGDLEIRSKWSFLTADQNTARLGMALVGFVTLPTGDSGDFYGHRGVTGGGRYVLDRTFGLHDVTINLGGKVRKNETITASGLNLLTVREQFLFGAGWKFRVSGTQGWYVLSEINGATEFGSEATTPLEWDAALQKEWWKRKLVATFGGGMGLTKGYGAPDWRIHLGVGYIPKRIQKSESRIQKTKQAQLDLAKGQIVILQPIHFAVNRAVIVTESFQVLEEVALLLKQNPKILKLQVDGHTDADGSHAYNDRLSGQRAESVVQYLIKQGVEVSRLVAKGWGERQPLAFGKGTQDKARNRRVEFHIVEMETMN